MNGVLIPVLLIIFALVLPVNADSFSTGGPYTIGDQIVISGETNYNTDNKVLVEVYPASFGPTRKFEPTMTGGNSTVVPVTKNEDGIYSWSATMSSVGWSPDQYMVRAEVIGKDFIETSVITLAEKSNANKSLNTGSKDDTTQRIQELVSSKESANQSPEQNLTSTKRPELAIS